MGAIKRALWWLRQPFVVRVVTVEHTRLRVRSFPPLLKLEYVDSLAERVTAGGTVYVEPGEYIFCGPLVIGPATSVVGAGAGVTVTVLRGGGVS